MIRVVKVDWNRLLCDLQHLDLTIGQIAHSVGRSTPWIKAVKNGGHQPKHHDGVALIRLWASEMKRTTEEAPLVRSLV